MVYVCVLMALFFSFSGGHRDLHGLTHSFPTRRSSDLRRADAGRRNAWQERSGVSGRVDGEQAHASGDAFDADAERRADVLQGLGTGRSRLFPQASTGKACRVRKEIGRASGRDRVFQYGEVSVVAGSLKKKRERK